MVHNAHALLPQSSPWNAPWYEERRRPAVPVAATEGKTISSRITASRSRLSVHRDKGEDYLPVIQNDLHHNTDSNELGSVRLYLKIFIVLFLNKIHTHIVHTVSINICYLLS